MSLIEKEWKIHLLDWKDYASWIWTSEISVLTHRQFLKLREVCWLIIIGPNRPCDISSTPKFKQTWIPTKAIDIQHKRRLCQPFHSDCVPSVPIVISMREIVLIAFENTSWTNKAMTKTMWKTYEKNSNILASHQRAPTALSSTHELHHFPLLLLPKHLSSNRWQGNERAHLSSRVHKYNCMLERSPSARNTEPCSL